jgi:transcription antitermination factor NusG
MRMIAFRLPVPVGLTPCSVKRGLRKMASNTDMWVALELSYLGEKEPPKKLRKELENRLKGVEVFVPAVHFKRRNDEEVVIRTMDGYAFVRAGLSPEEYLRLENHPMVHRVITRDTPEGRFMTYLPEVEIQRLRDILTECSLDKFQEGDLVDILEGPYRSLFGYLLTVYPEEQKADVDVRGLCSVRNVATIPWSWLRPTTIDELRDRLPMADNLLDLFQADKPPK